MAWSSFQTNGHISNDLSLSLILFQLLISMENWFSHKRNNITVSKSYFDIYCILSYTDYGKSIYYLLRWIFIKFSIEYSIDLLMANESETLNTFLIFANSSQHIGKWNYENLTIHNHSNQNWVLLYFEKWEEKNTEVEFEHILIFTETQRIFIGMPIDYEISMRIWTYLNCIFCHVSKPMKAKNKMLECISSPLMQCEWYAMYMKTVV